jgi:hypothetical protein
LVLPAANIGHLWKNAKACGWCYRLGHQSALMQRCPPLEKVQRLSVGCFRLVAFEFDSNADFGRLLVERYLYSKRRAPLEALVQKILCFTVRDERG